MFDPANRGTPLDRRFHEDPDFNALVTFLENLLITGRSNPPDLRTAVNYAVIRNEMRSGRVGYVFEESTGELSRIVYEPTPLRSFCSVCGSPQLDSPQGVTCFKGHGGAGGISLEEANQLVRKNLSQSVGRKNR